MTLPWRKKRSSDTMDMSRDEGFFKRLIRGYRQVNNSTFLEVTTDENGLRVVTWFSMEHRYERDEEVGWFRDRREIMTCFNNVARISQNGNFVVERSVDVRMVCAAGENGEAQKFISNHFLKVGPNKEKATICDRPADELKAISREFASTLELSSADLNLFRQNRLRFDEHHLVQVELADGEFGTLSRDCQQMEHTLRVVVALSREFILNRPANGWQSKLKPIQEAAASAASRQKYIAQATVHWAAPQAPPVIYEGRKFAAFIEHPWGAAVNTPIVEAHRQNLLDQKPDLWHRGSSWSYTTGAAYLPYLVTCTAAGVEADYNTNSLVTFHPPHHAQIGDTFGDTVKVEANGQDGARVWQKQMSKLVAVKSDTAKNFKVPPQYMVRSDVMPSDDATIFYLEFADGEVIPLCYAVKMPSTAFENWAATIQQAQAVCGTLPPKEVLASPGSITTGKEGHDPI